MNSNIDSFTDEQLLNLINNTIIEKTDFKVSEFTGGYISMTSTRNHTKETYKVALLFGYKNRNSQSITFDIKKDLVYIWTKSLLLKINSINLDDIGMDFNDINGLMSEQKEDLNEKEEQKGDTSYDSRTNVHCTSTSTSTQLHNTYIPSTYEEERTKIKNFIDLKEFLKSHHTTKDGKPISFTYGQYKLFIDDKGIPYHSDDLSKLSFVGSDDFYKYLYSNLDKTLSCLEELVL